MGKMKEQWEIEKDQMKMEEMWGEQQKGDLEDGEPCSICKEYDWNYNMKMEILTDQKEVKHKIFYHQECYDERCRNGKT